MNQKRLLTIIALAATGIVLAAVGILVVLVSATSGLPSALHSGIPSGLAERRAIPPTATARPTANPNVQLQALIAHGEAAAARATRLVYRVATVKGISRCIMEGRWVLDVDPENQVGHPYIAAPIEDDWRRAADAVTTALSLCPSSISLLWAAHDPRHPLAEWHTALIPSATAGGLDARGLQRYALLHETSL